MAEVDRFPQWIQKNPLQLILHKKLKMTYLRLGREAESFFLQLLHALGSQPTRLTIGSSCKYMAQNSERVMHASRLDRQGAEM